MEFNVMLELLLLIGSVQAEGAVDWCKKECHWLGLKHLKCIFHPRSSNELCPKIRSVITPEERRDILQYHNTLRDDVAAGARFWSLGTIGTTNGWAFQPSAAGNMRQMVWDYGLEENARIYASQCTVESHQPYHCAGTEEFPLVHMNKYDDSVTSLEMDNVFKEWVAENKKTIHLFYSERVIVRTYFPGPWDGLFAMIFSQTFKLGCAKVICDCKQKKPLYKTGSVACLYGPTANFSTNGYPIYDVQGLSCESCPQGTKCNYHSMWPHLCARPGDPEIPEEIPPRGGPSNCAPRQITLLLLSLVVPFVVQG